MDDVPDENDPDNSAVNICVGCGLCCDGTIFTEVTLVDVDEQPPLIAVRAEITQRRDQFFLGQPCAASTPAGCSIYEERPALCRTYKCDLLRRRDIGEITTSAAATIVVATTTQRDIVMARLRPLLPVGKPVGFAELGALDEFTTPGDVVEDVALLREMLREFTGT